MACVIYRRLPRAVFRSATFSTTKWTRSEPRDGLGRNYLLKLPRTSALHKDAIAPQETEVACKTTSYVNQKESPKQETSFDPDDPRSVAEPLKKVYSAISQGTTKHTDSDKARLRKMSKAPKKFRLYNDVETFSTKDDPRAFQQLRPEYQSVCYNTERRTDTSIEEGEIVLQKISHSLTPGEMTDFLEKLSFLPESHLAVVRLNPKLESLCRHSTSNLLLYTDSELIRILGAFVRLSPTNVAMLKSYEQEFCRRVGRLSIDELLLVADMFRYMSFGVPKFLNAMYRRLQGRCSDLSLVQAIQLVYVIGEGRHAPQKLLETLEALLGRYLTSLNLEEIGTVCLGFFKTNNGLSEHLMRRLGHILVEKIEEISNYALVNVLKMFRFTRVDHIPFFTQVGKVAHKRIPEMGTQGIMHVVLAFAAMHILSKDLLDAVALAMPDRVSYCRSKDLAKFLWAFGVLKYEPPNADVFYSAFINQIRKNLEEFKTFPEHFLTCLMGLAFCQQFPFDLIDIALSEDFVVRSSKISMFELKKDLFTIAGTVEIECPQYKGKKISQEFRKDVTDMLVELSSRDIHLKAEAIEAYTVLQRILGGPQYVKEHMILPHTRSKDLEVHLDVRKQPIAINADVWNVDSPLQNSAGVRITDVLLSQLSNASKEISSRSVNGFVKEPWGPNGVESPSKMCDEEPGSQRGVVKLAIQVTNRNQYLYGSKQLLGLHSLKRRQLQKLGYVVVEVPYWEWFPLAKRATRSEKVAYLRHKVFDSV